MKPMLASKWDERNEGMFPFWAQPKYDGIRVLIAEDGYAYTRSLKPIRNRELQSRIRYLRDKLAGLDGEIVVGDPTAPDCYTRTSSAVMSFENADIENARLYIFDVWNSVDMYDDRYGEILERMDGFPSWVYAAPSALLADMAMLNEYEGKRLEEGHEGVILRRRDQFYKFGRGTPKQGELIKLKRFEDMEAEIIAVHELMHNANEATINELGYTERSGHKDNLVPMGVLGAIEVRLTDEKWQSESVRIGTGFNDEMRRSFWHKRHSLIGQLAKFKYFPVGVKDAPRFPVFLGLRDRDDLEPAQGSLF